MLEPIRMRRKEDEPYPDDVMHMLLEGSEKVRHVAEHTMTEVKAAMGLIYK